MDMRPYTMPGPADATTLISAIFPKPQAVPRAYQERLFRKIAFRRHNLAKEGGGKSRNGHCAASPG